MPGTARRRRSIVPAPESVMKRVRPDTGAVTVDRFTGVDDSGIVVNPQVVTDGQIFARSFTDCAIPPGH